MNRTLLGEQIHGHLQLYSDLGVRYIGRPASRVKSRVSSVQNQKPEIEVIAKGMGARGVPPACSENAGRNARVPGKAGDFASAPIENQKFETDEKVIVPGETLEAIRANMGNCQKCKLAPTRTNLVFGSGNPVADLMFVGEAPGADEDEQGLPFVGRAGRLLTLIIESIGVRREDVYICNILKCRPPLNRDPEADEIAACEVFLFRQIAAVQPKVIVALGSFGAQTLLRTTETIGKLRGRLMNYRGVKLIATYHPAYLLRSPLEKRKVWEDMRIARDYIRHIK